MRTEIVDLYQYTGLPAPEGGRGILHCYCCETPAAVSTSRVKPGVLILAGGGYGHVSQREMEPVALRFLARGYSAFTLEYAVAPQCFPVQLREAAMAMRFIRQEAERFEVAPDMVAAIGFSAGGHLCGTLGTLYGAPEVADIGPGALLRPDALGLCYPVAVSWGRTHAGTIKNISGGDTALAARLSLERLVTPDTPPTFLWHTRDDAAVPCRNSLILAQALEENGVDFALHIYRHGCHGLSTGDEMVYSCQNVPEISPDVTGWLDAQLAFFAECGLKIKEREETI